MADTLKFGPEWLRALSDGNSLTPGTPGPGPLPSSASIPKTYKLADHRYGREEMLALYVPGLKMPDCLKEYPYIAVERAQDPLAVLQVTEEEQRIMSQSVNSFAAYRISSRGGPPLRGGRGITERGRGRGRGRGDAYLQRGVSYDEGDGFVRPRTTRPDAWEEGGGKRFDRRFDDNSAISPRKEYSRSLSSDNWREKSEHEEDDEGDWRRAGPKEKWGTRGNWREPGRTGHDLDRGKTNGGGMVERGGFDRARVYRRSKSGESFDEEDCLPEWSTAETDLDLDSLGTFDASGAFVSVREAQKRKEQLRSGDSQKEKEPHDEEERNSSEKNLPNTEEVETTQPVLAKTDWEEVKPLKQEKKVEIKEEPSDKKLSQPAKKTEAPKVKENVKKSDVSTAEVKTTCMSEKNAPRKTVTQTKTSTTAKAASSDHVDLNTDKCTTGSKTVKVKDPETGADLRPPKSNPPALGRRRDNSSEEDTLLRLEKAAKSMVATVTDDDHEEEKEPKPSLSPKPDTLSAIERENPQKWFYRDPQGELQGPFASGEMAEWFGAGYFTMNLLVKRGCDERFQPLGELIKRWGRVPFLPGPTPPPLLNSPVNVPQPAPEVQQQQEQLKLFQQQMLVQQQLLQQQLLVRQFQIQTIIQQLQQQDGFSKLPPQQQQQLALQVLLKQPQQQQLLQQQQQKLSPRSPPTEPSAAAHPVFQRSFSQPADPSQPQGEEPSVWGSPNTAGNWSQPTSVWDLEQPGPDADNVRIETEEVERLRRIADEKRKHEEEILRQQEELRQKQEELRRQQEEIQRQKEEMERQRQMEIQRQEEARRKEDEELRRQEEEDLRRREEEYRRQQDIQRQQELERQQQQELQRQQDLQRQQELQRQELKRQQESQRQQELQQQEIQRQQELQRQDLQRQQEAQKETEIQRQRQQEMQRRQDIQRQQEQQRQQQEALRRLQQQQQEHLAKIQLPSSTNWGSQENGGSGHSISLAQIQQMQEEKEKTEQEERQMEAQRKHMQSILEQQQQNQQQQKSWTKQLQFPTVNSNNPKSLVEIQEEQARQLASEREKKQQNQPQAKPNLSLGAATVWGNGSPISSISSNWASEGAWGNAQKAASMGFWEEPAPPAKLPSHASRKNTSQPKNIDNNFPALSGKPSNSSSRNTAKSTTSKVVKSRKDEEAVQRLFSTVTPEDEFTQWCENILKGMATSVDVPTFVAFLQEVDSPYEVHDYVRSYLGENKAAIEFAKQFLEKRSYYKNKAKQLQREDEDSIWGPAPAITPKETRPANYVCDADAKNKKQKGKKKVQKLDPSILGFTVHAAPDRINVGQIENLE